MLYRRFGRTNLPMPILSCGGMRYQQSWKDGDPISADSQRNLEATIRSALEAGINHIETARGYGTSEEQLGHVLPKLPRDKIIVQTKVSPEADPKDFSKNFERSMALLKLDYLDLFALHGINNAERLQWSVRPGGCLEAALKLKAQGRVRHVGFSTHGPTQVIVDGCNDGRFDYVNLHWYYVNPFNWPAVEAATKHDMGVFIISPSDKGGKLYQPSEKLVKLCAPLSPIVFNDVWCLRRRQVHTLSIGATKPADFDEHLKALPLLQDEAAARSAIREIEARLQAELVKTFGRDWVERWHVGIPEWTEVPGGVNIHEILRLRNYALAFDMVEFGKMRYNLLGHADHWFPGFMADKAEGQDLSACLRNSPFRDRIPKYLAEAHDLLAGPEVKRLGKH